MLTTRLFGAALLAIAIDFSVGSARATAQEQTSFPPEARASYEKGKGLQKNGQLDDAIRAYEEAIKLGMDAFPRVHLQRASSNLDLKKYETAIAQYTKFIDQFGLEKSCRY
jgi:tetratricopeptide (TPR) repeat protein